MFRRRGTGGGREGEIGLADAAIAVLGPVAFLWIVFQAFAAINSERHCEELGDIEVSERAARLVEWHAGQQREIASLDEAWRASCGASTPSPMLPPLQNEIMPDILLKVCQRDRLKVLTSAGLPADGLARLAAERAARVAGLAACIKGDNRCRIIAKSDERQRYASELKTWYDVRRKLLTTAEAALGRDCPQLKIDPNVVRAATAVPPALADVCLPERATLIAEAGVGQGEIDRQEQRLDAVLRAHLACAPSPPGQSGCRMAHDLGSEEWSKVRDDLAAWYRELRTGALADERLLATKQCPVATTPIAYANIIEPLRRHKVCPAADGLLIAEAGLTADDISRLLAHRARLDAGLRSCVGLIDMSCPRLDEPAIMERAAHLKSWVLQAEAGLAEARQLAEQCRGTSRPPGKMTGSVEPLAGLCPPERKRVLAYAGVDGDVAQNLADGLARARLNLIGCMPRPGELGCRRAQDLVSTQRGALVAELRRHVRTEQVETKALLEKLREKRCVAPTSVGPSTGREWLALKPLAEWNICPGLAVELLDEAGITAVERQALSGQRAALANSMRDCIGRIDTACLWLDPTQLAAAGQDLRRWHDAYRARVQADDDLAKRYCDRPSGTAPHLTPMPAPIFNTSRACREQWPSLMSEAQVRESDIDDLQLRHGAILERLRGCVANESASKVERSIRFIVCTAEFTLDEKSQLPMKPADVQSRFDSIARRVLKDLDAAVRPYNRLEVRGHTDATLIGSRGCVDTVTGVRTATNALLSSLRAHRFNEELLRAIERQALTEVPAARMLARLEGYVQELEKRARTDSAAQQLLARIGPHRERATPLRLYAIGVGSDEPAYKDIAEYAECRSAPSDRERLDCKNQFDRRIEFRFVREAGGN